MATPALTEELKNYNFYAVATTNVLQFSGTIKDVSGAPIDISTGWSLRLNIADNPTAIAFTATSSFPTPTMNADGTWSLTLTSTAVTQLPNGSRPFIVSASNDGLVTQAVAQRGTMTVSRLNS